MYPPKIKPAVCVPAPHNALLAVPILPPLAHAACVIALRLEWYSWVVATIADGVCPPAVKAAEVVPRPLLPPGLITAAKLAGEIVQVVPSYSSVCE